MSALGGIIQLKSIAIEERPMWRLHWSAFSSQRECVWQLTRFSGRKWKSGLNRIGHPDWVKLSVELNCAPNQNTKFFSSLLTLLGDMPKSGVFSCSHCPLYDVVIVILTSSLFGVFSRGSLVKEAAVTCGKVSLCIV